MRLGLLVLERTLQVLELLLRRWRPTRATVLNPRATRASTLDGLPHG